jgi:hypothetical protein
LTPKQGHSSTKAGIGKTRASIGTGMPEYGPNLYRPESKSQQTNMEEGGTVFDFLENG